MQITVDASEVIAFAGNAARAAAVLDAELTAASAAALAEGVGLAQNNAPVDTGALRGSIGIIEGPSKDGGSYGTSLVYAWMREEGGTIYGNPYLVFRVDGRLVFARSVTQSGTKYMERSAAQLEPRLDAIYGAAVQRALESF